MCLDGWMGLTERPSHYLPFTKSFQLQLTPAFPIVRQRTWNVNKPQCLTVVIFGGTLWIIWRNSTELDLGPFSWKILNEICLLFSNWGLCFQQEGTESVKVWVCNDQACFQTWLQLKFAVEDGRLQAIKQSQNAKTCGKHETNQESWHLQRVTEQSGRLKLDFSH